MDHHRRRPLAFAVLVTAVVSGSAAACGGGGGGAAGVELSEAGERGREIANANGCAGCHGNDGQGGAGPTWVGLAGSQVELSDGTVVTADDAYLARAISDPGAEVVAGNALRMPENSLTDAEIADVIAYIHDLSAAPVSGDPARE
jgi:cytochrome c oxidase subunit 2